MPYTGGLALVFRTRHDKAVDGALKVGAQVIVNGLKDSKPLGLRGGYTSGDFVSGTLLNSIFISEVFKSASGKFRLIGTNLDYALFWEVGHFNLFTQRYERQERWRPTLLRKLDQAYEAYHRAYATAMNQT